MSEAQDRAWIDTVAALLADEDDDVQETADGLAVKGALFARRSADGDLIVDLPRTRADDLIGRDVASAAAGTGAKGVWVVVQDADDWVELATESHQFVGEPAVGRDS